MFGINFYPTPENIIYQMLNGIDVRGKTILEPSAGHGRIVDVLKREGAEVIACEIDNDLRKILATKCPIISEDFLQVKSEQVSHIHAIIANVPFSADEKHILHMWEIAPAGCTIISLCNLSTVKNKYYRDRERLSELISQYGSYEDLGDCFSQAERKTGVEVACVRLQKPADNYQAEFEGFFLDEEPEEKGEVGIMSYNVVRDIVNRYVESIKIFDDQLKTAVKLNEMTGSFFKESVGFQCSQEKYQSNRNQFKKDLQKSGWLYIFDKMNLNKYSTKGLREDINKFVEQQTNIPFTMKNIYKMLELVIGTTEQRMDKAILEVFERVTQHHADNQYKVEGWKTNSHFLLTKRFIMPSMVGIGWSGEISRPTWSNSNFEMIEDLIKALCYITGDNYDDMVSFEDFIEYPYLMVKDDKYINDPGYSFKVKMKWRKKDVPVLDLDKFPGCKIQHNPIEWGKWFEWGYFKVRCYKCGTAHFEFKSDDLWGKFNQRVARLKGFPLFEYKKQTKYQDRQTGRKEDETAQRYRPPTNAKVLFEIEIK